MAAPRSDSLAHHEPCHVAYLKYLTFTTARTRVCYVLLSYSFPCR